MAVMISIAGEQPFKTESAAATIVALRMVGFEKTERQMGVSLWTKEGKPVVTISPLTVAPRRCRYCPTDDCPIDAPCWGI